MSGLYAALQDYSQENDLETVHDQQHANPDEMIVIVDTVTTDLEEHVEELAKDVDALQTKGADGEKLADAAESLEHHIAFIRGAREQGQNISALTARALGLGIMASMEGRGIPAAWYEGEADTLAKSFESNAYDYSAEAEAAATSTKDRILSMLRKAYAAVVEFFKSLVDRFRGAGTSIGTAGDQLQKLARELEDKTYPNDAQFKGASYLALFTNDGAFQPGNALKAAVNSIDKAYEASSEQVAFLKKKLESGSGDAHPASSVPLTGGWAIVVNEKGSASLKQVKKVEAGSKEVPAATVAYIREYGKELSALSVVLHGIEKDNNGIISELESSSLLAQNAIAKEPAGEAKAGSSTRVSEVARGISAVKGIVPLAVKHATRVATEVNRYARASAARYTGKKA